MGGLFKRTRTDAHISSETVSPGAPPASIPTSADPASGPPADPPRGQSRSRSITAQGAAALTPPRPHDRGPGDDRGPPGTPIAVPCIRFICISSLLKNIKVYILIFISSPSDPSSAPAESGAKMMQICERSAGRLGGSSPEDPVSDTCQMMDLDVSMCSNGTVAHEKARSHATDRGLVSLAAKSPRAGTPRGLTASRPEPEAAP